MSWVNVYYWHGRGPVKDLSASDPGEWVRLTGRAKPSLGSNADSQKCPPWLSSPPPCLQPEDWSSVGPPPTEINWICLLIAELCIKTLPPWWAVYKKPSELRVLPLLHQRARTTQTQPCPCAYSLFSICTFFILQESRTNPCTDAVDHLFSKPVLAVCLRWLTGQACTGSSLAFYSIPQIFTVKGSSVALVLPSLS